VIENLISQLGTKEKLLQYAPKNKKTKDRADSAYKRHLKDRYGEPERGE
jgi:hypothetical protein